MSGEGAPRRGFLQRLAGVAGLSAAAAAPAAQAQAQGGRADFRPLPHYARAQNYRSLKQSSYDRTGGNSDRWPIAPGETQEVFQSDGPGVITHIWFTIAAPGPRPSQGDRAAHVLGRQLQAQRGNAGRRFLRPEPGAVQHLPVGISELLADPRAELLLLHAVPRNRRASP